MARHTLRPTHSFETVILLIVAIALSLGLVLYFIRSGWSAVYFLPGLNQEALQPFRPLAVFTGQLPVFLHTFAFALLTAVALVARGGLRLVLVCVGWFVLEALFEVGQHPALSPKIVALLPDWFAGIPFIEATADYFRRGTFDPGDILGAALGAFAAGLTVVMARRIHDARTT